MKFTRKINLLFSKRTFRVSQLSKFTKIKRHSASKIREFEITGEAASKICIPILWGHKYLKL
jgi:hypothetical protein